jgi:hypothetical protein
MGSGETAQQPGDVGPPPDTVQKEAQERAVEINRLSNQLRSSEVIRQFVIIM